MAGKFGSLKKQSEQKAGSHCWIHRKNNKVSKKKRSTKRKAYKKTKKVSKRKSKK